MHRDFNGSQYPGRLVRFNDLEDHRSVPVESGEAGSDYAAVMLHDRFQLLHSLQERYYDLPNH